ncbi:hypothetical protein J7413_19445 [Shimia sp. R10_1]|uniref:hypothetical protein n=1 Tax=Shimia sp. R10_1 TaxID=2821095 RepID=UPI001ADBF509|nr:hypothetical protein [Shimia sp. R10_1]MBO9475717.1 hypothetical protein [Shimia sp. R10_1]
MQRLDRAYPAENLPENYLPLAMELRQIGQANGTDSLTGFHGFVALTGTGFDVSGDNTGSTNAIDVVVQLGAISDAVLFEPSSDAFEQVFKNSNLLTLSGPANSDLNDRTGFAPTGRSEKIVDGGGKPPSYIAVIDVGLVPWLTYGTSQFKRISHLDLEPGNGTTVAFSDWSREDSQQDMMTGPIGARMRNWVSRFPNCIYGKGASFDDFSHGIAMTDLACLVPEGETVTDNAGLIGIELPARVLEDPSGGILKSVLLPAVTRAIEIVRDLEPEETSGNVGLEIVLAYAFTGGPHSDDNRFAQELVKLVAAASRGNVIPTLHIPMGNHQQDSLYAELKGDDYVDWLLLPGDRTPNVISFSVNKKDLPQDGSPSLKLTAPGAGPSLELILDKGFGADIALTGVSDVIGSYYCNASPDGNQLRGRLTLGATRPNDRAMHPTPSGSWKLELGNTTDAQLWILRDDAVSFLSNDQSRKQTRFDHPDYKVWFQGRYGTTALDSTSPIKRAGSGSELAATVDEFVASVGSSEFATHFKSCGSVDKPLPGGGSPREPFIGGIELLNDGALSYYSGVSTSHDANRNKGTVFAVVDDGLDFAHHEVQITASGVKDTVIGTSVASALSGNKDARSIPATPPPSQI